MKDKIKEKLLKEIKSMEEAKSLRDSCYDYFYKKFGDNWEEQFYKKHLKYLKSNCAYLDLKLRLKQHEETSKAEREKFIKILDELLPKFYEDGAEVYAEEIKQRIKEE